MDQLREHIGEKGATAKHLVSDCGGVIVPNSTHVRDICTGLMLSEYDQCGLAQQLEVAVVVYHAVKAVLYQATKKRGSAESAAVEGAAAEGAEAEAVDRNSWEVKARGLKIASEEINQFVSQISGLDLPVKQWIEDLHKPFGDPGVTTKKTKTTILYPPSGEYAIVDPCNYVFEFAVGAVGETLCDLRQSVNGTDEDFTKACIKAMRVLRLTTLNLGAWQEKRAVKEADGKVMSASSIPSPELCQNMFDAARQVLTCLEQTMAECKDSAKGGMLPSMLLAYGTAYLQQASTFYYVNATNPSKLLMETVNQGGIHIAADAQPICEGSCQWCKLPC